MTLGECFNEIRKYRLDGSVSRMSAVAMSTLHDLKYNHFLGEEYPRSGWLVSFENDSAFIVHRGFKIEINLNPNVTPIKNHKKQATYMLLNQ